MNRWIDKARLLELKLHMFATSILFTLIALNGVQDKAASVELGVVLQKELPSSTVSEELVVLNVPHIRQKEFYCVPTSAAMILKYFDKPTSPGALKKLAEGHKAKTERNKEFTYWKDLQVALKEKGHQWRIGNYPKTDKGFEQGLEEIKASLRKELPVMIDVHISNGHTFVVIGFDDQKQLVYIRDPVISKNKIRIFTYQQLRKYWHNHRFSKSRSVLFSNR